MEPHTKSHGSPTTAAESLQRGEYCALRLPAIAAFYLITEHRAHLLGWLPFLLILACPLLHLFHARRPWGAWRECRRTAASCQIPA